MLQRLIVKGSGRAAEQAQRNSVLHGFPAIVEEHHWEHEFETIPDTMPHAYLRHAAANCEPESVRASRNVHGITHANAQRPAAPAFGPRAGSSPDPLHAQSHDLGELSPVLLAAVMRAIAGQGENHSTGGSSMIVDKPLWTRDEVLRFLADGTVPRGAPDSVDFMKPLLDDIAILLGGENPYLKPFRAALQHANDAHTLFELVQGAFWPDPKGEISFRYQPPALALAAAPGTGLANTRFYQDFRAALGLDDKVFSRLAGELEVKGLIFRDIFDSRDDRSWGLSFFGQLGQRLRECVPGQGVAAVMWHQDTYAGITHISVLAASPQGEITINHQESIVIGKDKPVDGLMPAALGVPSNTYDTTQLHEAMLKGTGMGMPEVLPVRASYERTGPPSAIFTRLRAFAALQAFNDRLAAEGLGLKGKQWLYAADPCLHTGEVKASLARGMAVRDAHVDALLKGRFAQEPNILPPGIDAADAYGHYVNNCLELTVRALMAGDSVDLPAGTAFDTTRRISEAGRVLFAAGLMPDTDPRLFDRMDEVGYVRDENGTVRRHPASFLAIGGIGGESTAAPGTPGVIPPHVPRNPPRDAARYEAERAKAEERFAKALAKNRASWDGPVGGKP
ncbi:hypothetical protein [Noviherbaspirillum soli]|uniref:hypothetical protein n=1 Tax=Noviherbaspirillum soli TaxID=1064518 RepID=UPI00188C87AD|nr:hypothetical protein [Noviherbaspirillum soli]